MRPSIRQALITVVTSATIAVVAAGPGSAQATQYLAPGAVRLLESGSVEAYPDSRVARQWLMGFRNVLWDACPTPDSRGAERRARVNLVEAGVNLTSYVTSASPQATEGREDGAAYVEARGCPIDPALARTIHAIILRNGAHPPRERDAPAFIQLLAPAYRTALGYGAEGRPRLTGELLDQRNQMADRVERYLRTRWQGEMDAPLLRSTAETIAEILMFSNLSEENYRYLLQVNYDGEEEVHLWPIPMIRHSLGEPNRTPFAPPPDPGDELMQVFVGWFKTWYENLRQGLGGNYDSDAAQVAVLDDLERAIRDASPPQLELVLSQFGPRPAQPAADEIAPWEPFGNAIGRLGGSACIVRTEGRYNRLHKVMSAAMGVPGMVSLEVSDLPLPKRDDPTEYTIRGPAVGGSSGRWWFDVRDFEYEGADLGPVDGCRRVRITAVAGRPGAQEDRGPIEVLPFNRSQPSYGQGAQAAGEWTRGRATAIEVLLAPETAERLIEALIGYKGVLEGRR